MDTTREDVKISVLLIFPDNKEAALGSPGFGQVFRTLDDDDSFSVDWGWYDDRSGRVEIDCPGGNNSYDVIGFSVPYELLYSNVVRCLMDLGLDPEKSKRSSRDPIVMTGGAAPIMNPVVSDAIADSVFIGEAETYLADAIKKILAEQKTGAARELTPMSDRRLSETPTVAPRFILPVEKIDSSFVTSFNNPSLCTFRDAGLVEVGRGCSRGCRFCAAGHIYLPVRHRSVESILHDVESYSDNADRIGLVGASISDHKYLKEIVREIIGRGFKLTTSSFRADMLDNELAELLKSGGLKTVTIAPEGGSERIRRIINKRLHKDRIIGAVKACNNAGIANIRLYYMIGLPWETESDIVAIPELTGEIRGQLTIPNSRITVSVNPFIPKPQTPFQWCPMTNEADIKRIYGVLEKKFRKMKGVSLKTLSARIAVREAVISMGGRAVGLAIIEHVRDDIPWKKALRNNNVDSDRIIHTFKDEDHRFPWDAITTRKTKTALYASFDKARRAAIDS